MAFSLFARTMSAVRVCKRTRTMETSALRNGIIVIYAQGKLLASSKLISYRFDRFPMIARPCFCDEIQASPRTKLKPTTAARCCGLQTETEGVHGINVYFSLINKGCLNCNENDLVESWWIFLGIQSISPKTSAEHSSFALNRA